MVVIISNRKWFLLLATITITMTFLVVIKSPTPTTTTHSIPTYLLHPKPNSNWRKLSENETKTLSVLGRILFLNEQRPKIHISDKNYEILVWKYGKTIENRHLKHWTEHFYDPFEYCSVSNCEITYEDAAAKTADIIIFHMHRMKKTDPLPTTRRPEQIWAFLTDESPLQTFMGGNNNMQNYNGLFNWSMTYRMDSDIPVPYGRTVTRRTRFVGDLQTSKRRDVLIAAMGSNCGGKNHRWDYVKELQKHIKIDFYGKCGTLKCPGHFQSDCPALNDYMFFLAFENTNCDEYLTEKVWWNAYAKNSIPVVMGASRQNLRKLLPPSSYLSVEDYAHPVDLAKHILYLNRTENFLDYYVWKRDYEILNEHGYFQTNSYHYCRVCEALNYNDRRTKVYENLTDFWNGDRDCYPAWNAVS